MAESPRTTVVGSYPVPDWLITAPSRQAVIDATKVVFQTQELAGIDVVADGELYRWDVNHPDTNGMIDYFVRPLGGVRRELGRSELDAFAREAAMGFRAEPPGIVIGPLHEGTLNLPRDFRRARACTDRPLRFTVTGPHMLAKTLLDHHYRDRAALATAVADVLAAQVAAIAPDVIQLDEANITGHPDEVDWAAGVLNRVLDASPAREKGVHLCFGNYGGQSIQRGTWRALVGYLNRLRCDHVVLEFARRGFDELAFLRDELDPRIALGIGVIDVKDTQIETPDTVARRIQTAADLVGLGRIGWVHPDCGFWMLRRSIADGKMAALVRGRDVFLGVDEAGGGSL
jgi:5-methyltetrahydropteroyltriglutamate--homocysteine methyltransferase